MTNQFNTRGFRVLGALCALLVAACSDGPSHGTEIPINRDDMDAAVAQYDSGALITTGPDAAPAGPCTDEGCTCSDDSEPMNCYPPPILSPNGTNLCAQGSQYCRDGKWSACQSLIQFGLDNSATGTVTPAATKAKGNGLSGISSALISTPTTCNPCHPNCFDAVDRPVATDLTTTNVSKLDAGTDSGSDATVLSVTYDPVQAGIRLTILSDTAQRGPILQIAVCGNGILQTFPAGVEQCDDGNTRSGDGCSNSCLLEAGYFCPTAGFACQRSVCGNAVKEGLEACDDGNLQIGDGCTPQCAQEPTCVGTSPCTAVCGDGKKFTTEACDDGNVTSGDGCSASCAIESGWYCTTADAGPPPTLDLPIVYRDFAGVGLVQFDAGSPRASDGGIAYMHPDFENLNAAKTGMVAAAWETDSTKTTFKKPVYANPQPSGTVIQSATSFNQWYTDAPVVNTTFADTLTVTLQSDGSTYAFDTTTFFPLDGKAGSFPVIGKEKLSSAHDFSFTSEVRFWFVYTPGQKLDFRGDDDVWVFINGKLAVDIGGVHGPATGSITLNATANSTFAPNPAAYFNLTAGGLYEAAVFQAERHTSGSNYRLTLAGFFSGKTSCVSRCGDGIVTPDEFCDDGSFNGQVGFCLPDCQGRSPKYASSASYWRDYTATGTCKIPPERPLWGSLTWATTSTSGGSITFNLQGAETAAGVATAPIVAVPITVSAAAGSFDIYSAMQAAGALSDAPYLRVTAVLASSADQTQTPVLKQFDVAHTCVNVE